MPKSSYSFPSTPAVSSTLRIPFPLRTDEFKATYRQGFLIITVPKAKEPAISKVEVNIR